MTWILPAVACLIAGLPVNESIGRRIDNFELQDFRGKKHALTDAKDAKIVVVAFLGVECPLAQMYAPRLQQLADAYKDKQVAFIGIDSNEQDSITELAAFARKQGVKFPLLKDPGNRVADKFGAKRTPEVFVLNADRKICYRGRVDDRFGIGYVQKAAKHNELEAALAEVLAGKPVTTTSTEIAGCIIGRVKEPRTDSAVTYSKQIARIFQDRCVECHRTGDIGPFALTNYTEASGWAEMIQEVVSTNRMPPWHADPKHGKFADSRRLSDDERKLIRQWVDAGAPEGDPKELPKPRTFATGWHQAKQPDLVLPMRATPFSIPANGEVRYQYFMVDPGIKEDKWIAASEVMPGNRAVVHHLLVLVNGPGADIRESRGGAGGFLAAYVPGLRAKPYPEGMAKKLTVGSKLIFQIHYTTNGSPQQDLSKLALWFVDDPKKISHEVRTVSAATNRFEIPAHDGNHKVEATTKPLPVDVLLLAMMPHMHLRGKAFRYDAEFANNKTETLLDVPHYDFNWQSAYRLADIRTLPRGTKIHGTAHYDNSDENLANPDSSQTVYWGDQTYEEMMIGYFDIAIPKDKIAEFNKAGGGNLRGGRPGEAFRNRITGEMLLKRFDKNGDGVITRDEVPENLRQMFDRLDANHDGKLDKKELSQVGKQPGIS